VLSIEACILLAIAWKLPEFVGENIIDGGSLPQWLRTTLGVVWGIAMIIVCPLAFRWMARTFWSSWLGGRG
jgi:hypothetical protein